MLDQSPLACELVSAHPGSVHRFVREESVKFFLVTLGIRVSQFGQGARVLGVEKQVGEEVCLVGAIAAAEGLEEEFQERREVEIAPGHDVSRDHAQVDGGPNDEIVNFLDGASALATRGCVELLEKRVAPGVSAVVDDVVDDIRTSRVSTIYKCTNAIGDITPTTTII